MNRPEILIRPSIGITRNVFAVIDDLGRYLNHPEKIDTHIHHIRTDIKKLRAWIRLVRNRPDKQEWQEIDHYLSDMAKQLSAARDEQVIPLTLVWLEKKTKKRDIAVSINRVNSHLHSVFDVRCLHKEIIKIPEKNYLDNLKRITLTVATNNESIRRGLQKTYKRALKHGGKACSDKGTVADLHRFRRWVKYLYYQVDFIEGLYGGGFENIQHQLDKLGKRLGRIHDLVLIKTRLKYLPDAGKCNEDVCIVNMAADRMINKLIKQTKKSFDRIFVLKPGKFTAGLQRF